MSIWYVTGRKRKNFWHSLTTAADVFFFCLVCLCFCVFPPAQHNIFHMPMTRYSLFVLKVSLNTNKTNKQ